LPAPAPSSWAAWHPHIVVALLRERWALLFFLDVWVIPLVVLLLLRCDSVEVESRI
jgi:hypothetical protein